MTKRVWGRERRRMFASQPAMCPTALRETEGNGQITEKDFEMSANASHSSIHKLEIVRTKDAA